MINEAHCNFCGSSHTIYFTEYKRAMMRCEKYGFEIHMVDYDEI